MTNSQLELVLVSTPIGHLGSGAGGGVELTLSSLIKGLLDLGHKVIVVAPDGSDLPTGCAQAEIKTIKGIDQPSWQHQLVDAPVIIPNKGVLPRLWDEALELGKTADAVLNFSYDWLPIWLTQHVQVDLFHLISMGHVSHTMTSLISEVACLNPSRFAFHTQRQAQDYSLNSDPIVVGNGFDLGLYQVQLKEEGPIGWAGRIAPEKGLEDAVAVAAALEDRLVVWGLIEDSDYASAIENSAPQGTIDWRGFLITSELQKQLGSCRVLLNTPKWNEAYGNVVVEAMACGVPVIAYDRGGPGELITSGVTGWLVPPDDIRAMTSAVSRVEEINRSACRKWVERFASKEAFAKRVESWIIKNINNRDE